MTNILAAIEAGDIRVARAVAPIDDHPVGHAIGKLGEAGDQPPLLALAVVTAAAGVFRNDRKLAAAGLAMLVAQSVAGELKKIVKSHVERTRPRLLIENDEYAVKLHGSKDPARSSFPSGHTAGAVAVAAVTVRAYPEQRLAAFGAAAVLGVLQVPRRAHYVSDVVAGALVGLVAGKVTNIVTKLIPAGVRD